MCEGVRSAIQATLLVLLASVPASQIAPASAAGNADSSTAWLSPASFPELPFRVRRELEKGGYQIPQPCAGAPRANVIRGHFARRGHTDWAVLGSRGGFSSILIFWGGAVTRVDSIARQSDATYLQTVEPGKIGYSRKILNLPPAGIRWYYE